MRRDVTGPQKELTPRRKEHWPDAALSAALGKINHAAFDYYPRLQRVNQFVASRLSEHISLQDVAEVAAYETTYFCAVFHRRVGVPFRTWLTMARVTKATELIRSRDHSMSDVAHAVGFGSVRAFERAFKSVVLSSPREYKKITRPC